VDLASIAFVGYFTRGMGQSTLKEDPEDAFLVYLLIFVAQK
jgi:hypothetical protein